MSSYSQTILSRNQSFDRKINAEPSRVGHRDSEYTPQTTGIMPAAETQLNTAGGILWRAGTGALRRSIQIRSPSTAFEAQLSVERGMWKILGLSQAHRTATRMASIDHLPIQARLQKARMRSGSAVLRVQTLQGFAWRSQAASFIPKILCMMAALFIFLPWMLSTVSGFAQRLFESIPNLIR